MTLLAALLRQPGGAAYRQQLLPAAPLPQLLAIGEASLLHDSLVLRKAGAEYMVALCQAGQAEQQAAAAAAVSAYQGQPAAGQPEAPACAAWRRLERLMHQLCAGSDLRRWEGACELLCACCESPQVRH